MYRRDYIIIWSVSLVTLVVVSTLFSHPGYMDAFYYYHVAENIAQGQGLVERFVWNYLPPPDAVTHPSNTYWMPLVSLVAAPFLLVFGAAFRAAQLPFVLLSSLVPIMTAALVWRLTANRAYAVWSALFTLFSGFYLTHWIDIDSFGIFAISTGITLFLMGELCAQYKERSSVGDNLLLLGDMLSAKVSEKNGAHTKVEPTPLRSLQAASPLRRGREVRGSLISSIIALPYIGTPGSMGSRRGHLLIAALVGVCTALAHLSRADGPLLLVVFGFVLLLTAGWRHTASMLAVTTGVYLLAMMPWLLRNILMVGTPLPSQGASVIFMREYNDLYSYGVSLSAGYLLDHGLWNILADKANALLKNLAVLHGGALFLLPFTLLGAWSQRKEIRLLPVFVYGAMLYLTFSLLFTHAGVRGSMIHTAVALLPWSSLLAVHGTYTAVRWVAARRKGWKENRAQLSFTAIALFFSAFMAFYIAFDESQDRDRLFGHYAELSNWIEDTTEAKGPLMLTNPPAYAYVSKRPSIATPSNGVEALLAAADSYGVSLLALEYDHAKPLEALYDGRETHPRLEILGNVGNTRAYRIKPEEPARSR